MAWQAISPPSCIAESVAPSPRLFCEVDGNFPNHHPDPSDPHNLQDLIAALRNNDSELGLAFDGDGDRLGVVTKDGKIIFPDRQLMLFAADVLSRNAGAEIIFDVKSTRNLFGWIREHGGKPTLWKTGHSLVKAKMRETGALLAGEMSGHVFFKERWYGFDDGLYAGARLLEILSKVADSSATLNALPDAICTPGIAHPHRRRREPCLIARLQQEARLHRCQRHHHHRRTACGICRRLWSDASVQHHTSDRAAFRSG